MPEVKWIKLLTSLPSDEKIKSIKLMPDRFAIFYVWIMLLIQAGKCNAGGLIYLAEDIPYTEEELANEFDMPVNTLKLALLTYKRLKMIEIHEDGHIFIPNFSVIQNIEGLDKIREQTRLRVQRHRNKVKQLPAGNVTETLRNGEVTQQNKTKTKSIDNKSIIKGDKSPLFNKNGEKVKRVFLNLDKIRGYRPPKRKAEAASIIRMLKNYTPDQIISTYEEMKQDKFWADKELYMMSVESQIGAVINKKEPIKKNPRALPNDYSSDKKYENLG